MEEGAFLYRTLGTGILPGSMICPFSTTIGYGLDGADTVFPDRYGDTNSKMSLEPRIANYLMKTITLENGLSNYKLKN